MDKIDVATGAEIGTEKGPAEAVRRAEKLEALRAKWEPDYLSGKVRFNADIVGNPAMVHGDKLDGVGGNYGRTSGGLRMKKFDGDKKSFEWVDMPVDTKAASERLKVPQKVSAVVAPVIAPPVSNFCSKHSCKNNKCNCNGWPKPMDPIKPCHSTDQGTQKGRAETMNTGASPFAK